LAVDGLGRAPVILEPERVVILEHIEPHSPAKGFVKRFFHDLTAIVLAPGTFFEKSFGEKSTASAVSFLAACSLISSLLAVAVAPEGGVLFASIFFLNAFLTPIVMAAVLYPAAILFCRGVFSFTSLLGIMAFAGVSVLAAPIPGFSWVSGLWRFFLIGIGLAKVGRIGGYKAFGMIIALCVILLAALRFIQPPFDN
jgi:hypothetical protein